MRFRSAVPTMRLFAMLSGRERSVGEKNGKGSIGEDGGEDGGWKVREERESEGKGTTQQTRKVPSEKSRQR